MEPCIPADLAAWKAAARAGGAPADAILRKGYTADQVKAEDGDSRKVSFTISTGAIDRDRDTLKASGWQLDAYRANPVVLWAHQYAGLPIARAESIKVTGGALKAVAEFASAEMNPLAESVLQMLKGGFLRATSVGFRPLKHAYDEERMGFDFLEQELLEFSVVPVPANPQALMDAKAAGVAVGPLKAWAEQVLDGMEPGLWVPNGEVLAGFKALSEPRIVVPAFDPAPYVAGVRERLEKRGRVLSQANEDRILRARDGAEACMAALDEVMASMPMDEGDDDKSARPFLMVAPSAAPATLLVNPNDLKAAMVAAARDEIRAQINYATGRLD